MKADKMLPKSTKIYGDLNLSSECSSVEEYDKQTLREVRKSEIENVGRGLERSPERFDLGPEIQSLELKLVPTRPTSSGQTTAGQSLPNSKQEFGFGPNIADLRLAHTESSGSKRGLARHRNSIGLLTDNHKADVRSFSQFTSKDTPCQNSSASKESYLFPQGDHKKVQGMQKSPTFAKLSLRKGSGSLVSTDKQSSKVADKFLGASNLQILIEPLEESSITQGHSNHQVPLISRIPASMMKRLSMSRTLFRAKKKTKILLRQEPVLAHHQGDDCLPSDAALAVDSPAKPPVRSVELPTRSFRLMLTKTNSAADESFLFNSRRFLDESSVRLQSNKGSNNSIPKRQDPSQVTPIDCLNRTSNGLRKWSFNFPSVRFNHDQPVGYEPSSCMNSGKSNICTGQLPAFEVSRMLLVVPRSFRSSCIKQRFPSSKRLIAQRPVESLHPEDGTRRQDAANGGGSPELDTNLDLGAMIRDCDVLQKHLIDPDRS